jgi:hypothetical protein
MFLANFRHRVPDSADKMNFVETWGSKALGFFLGQRAFLENIARKIVNSTSDLTNLFTSCVEFNISILKINFILISEERFQKERFFKIQYWL